MNRAEKLAHELLGLDTTVTIYHNKNIQSGTYFTKSVEYGFFKSLPQLCRANHQVYFTTGLLIPALQLTVLNYFNGTPFILGVGAPYWKTFNQHHGPAVKWIMHKIIYPLMFKMVLRRASSIIANSEHLAVLMRGKYQQFSAKIKNIYNGIDYEHFQSSRLRVDLTRNGPLTILSVGTANFKEKSDGIIALMTAIAEYMKQTSDVVFNILVKSSSNEQTDRLIAVRESFPDLDINLIFNSQSVPEFIDNSDIFIYSTPYDSSDSLPRVLLEAQAMGIPTIATNSVGCPEVVIHGETGLVIDNESSQIINSIEALRGGGFNTIEMSKRGKERVRRIFNWNKMAEEYLGIIKTCFVEKDLS